MVVTNNPDVDEWNERDEFSLSISDTNVHDLPDTDGDDSTGGALWDGSMADSVAAYVQNGQDQPLTATLYRRPKPESNVEITDVADIIVEANDTDALIANESAPMGAFRVVVKFDTAPSGNDNTTVAFDWGRS